MKARVTGSAHPRQVIMKGIARRWVCRAGEVLAVRAGKRAEIIIEGVIFFYDDHDVFDCHSNLPVRSLPCLGANPCDRLTIQGDGPGMCELVHAPRRPARHLQDADHRRGRAKLADDRLPVPTVAVLSGDRWWRRVDTGRRRARPRLPARLAPGSEQGAGLPARHRRECRDADDEPNGGFHLLARLPRRWPQGVAEAGITHRDVDHLMIYDAPCSLP